MTQKSRTIIAAVVVSFMFVLGLAACKTEEASKGDDAVLAVVDGTKITVADFKAANRYVIPKDLSRKKEALNRMIRDMLVSKYAVHEGFVNQAEVDMRLKEFYADYLPDRLRGEIADGVTVTDEELPQGEIKNVPVIELYQITTPTVEEAEKALAELEGGEEFEEVAKKRSKGLAAPSGGHVGQVDMSTDLYSPYVKAVINKLAPGEISPITKTEFGYAIFKVKSRMSADEVRETSTENLREKVKKEKVQEEFDRLIEKLREDAHIEFNQKLLDGDLNQTWAAKVNDMVVKFRPGLLDDEDGAGAVHQPHRDMSVGTVMKSLNDMINGFLLSDEAVRRGLDKDPDFQKLKKFELDKIISDVYIEKGLGNFEATPQDLKDYYDKNKEYYRLKEAVRIRRILVKTRHEADKVKADLDAGMDFSEAAGKWSVDKSKLSGGDMGWHYVEGLIGPIKDVLPKMKEGETSPVFESEYGFEILKLEGVRKGGIPDISDISGKMKKKVLLHKQSDAVQALMDKVVNKAEVKLDEELLESL